MHDRRQPVSNDDGRAALAKLGQRFLHLQFGFGVKRGSRLIEQDDRRVLDQGARDGDALPLAAGKLQAMLADRRIVTRRKTQNEVVRVRGPGGGDNLRFAGADLAECDVVANRAAEQMNDLPDIGDLFAERAA